MHIRVTFLGSLCRANEEPNIGGDGNETDSDEDSEDLSVNHQSQHSADHNGFKEPKLPTKLPNSAQTNDSDKARRTRLGLGETPSIPKPQKGNGIEEMGKLSYIC